MRVEIQSHICHSMLAIEWKAAQSFCNLNELFGDISLENKPGRGRPSDFDDWALLAAVEEGESLTTRMLAEDFNVKQMGRSN
ncbi:hypothetical protein TNIN_180871 [Trichonephila inaurata madagascariensis]|uniref:Uncharacterized protein n=1 Tax=Trichonephila inaurata madagascariensis TaxID=2747483 RepID=A0A8X6IMT1_9ARAC|nr:hypothetical protein TNIN_180871 [Trichonephila inaurata madagascariensis]